jgi:uncharacterized protein (TIGR04255 family)
MANLYKRAPITEAVVEFRFAGTADLGELEKARARLSEFYSGPTESLLNFTYVAGAGPAGLKEEFNAFRMTSGDGCGVAVVGRGGLTTSRLAPYEGWEHFIERATGNWAVWRKSVAWSPLVRIGLRYINRIDVPAPDSELIDVSKYLKINLQMPTFTGASPTESFAINCALPIRDTRFKLIINAGTTPSPLLKTSSMLLDLDLSQEADLPASDAAIWKIVESMRPIKNQIFEALVTDNSRELFQHD